jgi:DNA transformation protein
MENEFVEHVLRQLSTLGLASAKPMFGGHGLYLDEVFFAVVDDDVLFFKVDAASRVRYLAAGMGPFHPLKNKPPMEGYYEVPLDVLEDRARLREWGGEALSVARRVIASKSSTKPKAEPAVVLEPDPAAVLTKSTTKNTVKKHDKKPTKNAAKNAKPAPAAKKKAPGKKPA